MLLLDNVTLHHDTKRHGEARFALGNVSLAVPVGSFRWLVGPSGAGKSSLLHLLNLSLRPSRGRLEVLGADVARASRARRALLRRRIGMVYQDYRLLGELTTIENVALPLRLARQPDREVLRESRAILSWLGLSGRENVLPERLSGGERQRVAIARALIGRPDLVLADEPTNALGETQARQLIESFQEIARGGATVIVATHNEALLREFPAPMILLNAGTAQEVAPATPSRSSVP